MIFIKRFLDKISTYDGKNSKDVILPLSDARGLRDDIAKLLLDYNNLQKNEPKDEVIKINLNGGSFK